MRISRSNRTSQNASRPKVVEDLQALSHRILQCATQGVLRMDFQQKVTKMIMDFSGCDAVELWLKEHGKYFRCTTKRHLKQPFSFEMTSYVQNENGEIIPNPDDDPDLVYLCSDMTRGCVDPSEPVFTKNGRFWTGSTKNPLSLHLRRHRKLHGHGSNLLGDYPSLVWIPLLADKQNVGLLHLRSKRKDCFAEDQIELYKTLAKTLAVALIHRHAQVDLRERVKELTCLYGIAHLAAQPNVPLEEILQSIAELLPQAWLYPDITFAEIILDGHSYSTAGFKEGKHKLVADIIVSGAKRGVVKVVYLEEKPELDEGPFLKEERNLIDTIAREVAIIVTRREAEQDKSRLQEQLRHADRLATIGQLAAGVAHELNEPLANILGFAQLVKKSPDLPKQVDQDIEKILNASLYAREIVKKLLIFARLMPPKKTLIHLNKVVEEGLYLFESRCVKEGIELIRDLSPDLPGIHADPSQLNQVLVNLVINAIQAMPSGGRLILRTLHDKDRVSLMVEDTGIGMDGEVLKKIFTPFFTTKDVGQGTGLGLPVVHGIITSHGGSIHVESKVGSGTRFEIQLPGKEPLGNWEI